MRSAVEMDKYNRPTILSKAENCFLSSLHSWSTYEYFQQIFRFQRMETGSPLTSRSASAVREFKDDVNGADRVIPF